MDKQTETLIRTIVRNQVKGFSTGFSERHLREAENPEGTINSKVHNAFIAALGPEIQFYSALVRSLDSSLGSLIEAMALEIAETHFEVHQRVKGSLYVDQTRAIADLLQSYLTRRKVPSVEDYQALRQLTTGEVHPKTHASDYMLRNKANGDLHLVELKLGGDLDNKKARSEKEALLEQYCILANSHDLSQSIQIHFATAYNRYGEGQRWKQERVRQFFAEDELLISSDFWNFLAQDDQGFQIVMDEYSKQAPLINDALEDLKEVYVGR